MPKKEQFQEALRSFGHGDPDNARILFLGIDDGYGVTEPDDLVDFHTGSSFCAPGEIDRTAQTSIIARIITALQNPDHPADWKEYRRTRLCTQGSEAFLAYMFPIGRDTQEGWPTEYETEFGMFSNDYYAYVLRDRPGRLGLIDKLWSNGRFRLLVFFGMSERTRTYWKAFIAYFGLESEIFIGMGERIRIYTKQQIVMLPPLTNASLTKPRLEAVVSLILENGLNPFS